MLDRRQTISIVNPRNKNGRGFTGTPGRQIRCGLHPDLHIISCQTPLKSDGDIRIFHVIHDEVFHSELNHRISFSTIRVAGAQGMLEEFLKTVLIVVIETISH